MWNHPRLHKIIHLNLRKSIGILDYLAMANALPPREEYFIYRYSLINFILKDSNELRMLNKLFWLHQFLLWCSIIKEMHHAIIILNICGSMYRWQWINEQYTWETKQDQTVLNPSTVIIECACKQFWTCLALGMKLPVCLENKCSAINHSRGWNVSGFIDVTNMCYTSTM